MRLQVKNKVNLLKKIGIGLFFFLCFGQGFCVNAQEPVFEKDGGVYLIQSAEDMRTLAELVNQGEEVAPGVAACNASYRLTQDIDLSAYCTGEGGWEPIGYRDGSDESLKNGGYFNGFFDGDNHVVTGLYINRPEEDMMGLFGVYRWSTTDWDSVGSCVIKNLYIENCNITGNCYVGGVIGGMDYYHWDWVDSRIEKSGASLIINVCHIKGKTPCSAKSICAEREETRTASGRRCLS